MMACVCVCAGAVVTTPASAQQKRIPDSLPPVFTSNSVHTTAPSKVVAGADTTTDALTALITPSTRASSSDQKDLAGSCKNDSVVCFDYRSRSARLPIAKELMPEVPGLKKESLSIKRDKVSLNYSF